MVSLEDTLGKSCHIAFFIQHTYLDISGVCTSECTEISF